MSEPLTRRRVRELMSAARRDYLTTPACLLLVLANVSWRQNVYFSGELDPTVIAKAGLALIALLMSAGLAMTALRKWQVAVWPLLLYALYLALNLIGAYSNDTLSPTLVLVVRLTITVATITLLLTARPFGEVAQSLTRSVVTVGLVASITGIPSLSTGRLSGAIPALAPNELSLMFSIPALWVARKFLDGKESGFDRLKLIGSLLIVFATGSRTGILALALALLAMMLYLKRLSIVTLLGGIISLPFLLAFVLFSPVFSAVANRGGSAKILTLTNRTIAWEAAFSYHTDSISTWLGSGLSVKKIPVAGQYWATQILDSTWVSALVQGGYLGMAVIAVLAVAGIIATFHSAQLWRPFLAPMMLLLVGRSFLESGLFDATLAFLYFMLAALGSVRSRVELSITGEPLDSTTTAKRSALMSEVTNQLSRD